jgi:hypothetical protein
MKFAATQQNGELQNVSTKLLNSHFQIFGMVYTFDIRGFLDIKTFDPITKLD